ncbi:MAG: M3 family metallopeptidase [Bacteroidetes bacterium]|nr:M3 family metallopeptidase [Bacteroidota bacterium]
MNRKLLLVGIASLAIAIPVTLNSMTTDSELSSPVEETAKTENILTPKWTGNYGGIPPLDKVKVADFKPALEMAMNEKLAEIEKIANNPEPATFENTIAALERSGQMYDRVITMFGIWSTSMNDEDFQKVDTEMAPKLSEFDDKIVQNEKLFKRIEQVYNTRETGNLTPEQQRLVWSDYTYFVSAGAKLSGDAKQKMSKINQDLASLFTKFGQNLLADESNGMVEIKSEADLAGLSSSMKNGYANAAKDRKLDGSWVISNTRSSVEPFLTYSENRALREKVWQMFVNRGDNGDDHDSNKIITQILNLRKERAKLLGFKNHAEWRLQNSMAKTPQKAMELMESVWPAAIARVKEEVADMQAMADKEGAKIKIEPWDYRFYAEKVRKEKYDLDQNEVKEYLQLEKLREGMFWVAGELFNFSFTPLSNIPVYHADVKVWEVKDKTSGKHIGLWYFDPYARKGKRSGAWMNAYRNQQRMEGNITTIVSNNSNFIKGNANEPVLISWDDASTLFHEFGHALHGLASNVTYPTLSGTNVVRDYVEFPSQLLEHWLSTPEVLNKFAIHYKTGTPIPKALVDRIEKASTFNEGFATTEFLSSALVDMKLHTSDQDNIDPDKFEKDMLKELNMPSEIVMRHRTPQFAHIFSSDSYSAGYYSYLWADVLTADAYSAFTEAGGPYDKAVAASLNKNIFSVGNTIDPEIGFKTFRGRNADTKALMKKRGFPVK